MSAQDTPQKSITVIEDVKAYQVHLIEETLGISGWDPFLTELEMIMHN